MQSVTSTLSCLMPHSFSSQSGLRKCWTHRKYVYLLHRSQGAIHIVILIIMMMIGLSDLLVWPIKCCLFLTPVKPIPTRDSTSEPHKRHQETITSEPHSKGHQETGQASHTRDIKRQYTAFFYLDGELQKILPVWCLILHLLYLISEMGEDFLPRQGGFPLRKRP